MNVETPRCPRCEGTRFFHVLRMLDAIGDHDRVEWKVRPVGVAGVGGSKEDLTPLGHFETLLCRGCGHTIWYGRDWEGLQGRRLRAHCNECDADTSHLSFAAVELTSAGFEPVRITHGILGREGFMQLSLCTTCDRASWRGTEYAHLEGGHFVDYRVTTEPDRRCLTCLAADAIVDEKIYEYDRVPVSIAHAEAGPLQRFFGLDKKLVGHFSIRLCRPCGAVEWYAQQLDKLVHDPAHGVLAIGEPPAASTGGPYR